MIGRHRISVAHSPNSRHAAGLTRRPVLLAIVGLVALALAVSGARWAAHGLGAHVVVSGSTDTGAQTARRAVSVPELPLAPATLPTGWFVSSATTSDVPARDAQTLYARSGDVDLPAAAGDAGIVIGEGGEDLDIPIPATGAMPVPGLGGPDTPGRLQHLGEYTVLGWRRTTEATTFAIGRNISDAELIRAARAAVFAGSAPSVPARALPDGLQRVTSTPLLPRESGHAPEQIRLTSADGRHDIRMLAYTLSEPADNVDEFLADLPAFRSTQPSAQGHVGESTMLVRGDAPATVVDALARSTAALDPPGWSSFQRRALDLPLRALFSDCGPLDDRTVVIQAVQGTLRWAVALPTAVAEPSVPAPCVGVKQAEADRDDNPQGEAGPGTSGPGDRGDAGSLGGITVLTGENTSSGAASGEHLVVIAGRAPAGTTRVVVRDFTGPTVDAKLADAKADPGHRYWAAAFIGLTGHYGTAEITAYAAGGHALGGYVHHGPGGI